MGTVPKQNIIPQVNYINWTVILLTWDSNITYLGLSSLYNLLEGLCFALGQQSYLLGTVILLTWDCPVYIIYLRDYVLLWDSNLTYLGLSSLYNLLEGTCCALGQ